MFALLQGMLAQRWVLALECAAQESLLLYRPLRLHTSLQVVLPVLICLLQEERLEDRILAIARPRVSRVNVLSCRPHLNRLVWCSMIS